MRNETWVNFSRTALAAAVAVVTAAPAMAQNTTAAVGGRVVGAEGKPLAGAAVTVLHVESGSANNLVTDSEGRYAVRGLRAGGPYTVTISKDGLSDVRQGVFLLLAETTNINATLPVPQTITVTGRGVSDKFNSSNMGAGTTISSRDLAAYASVQRNLQDYARTDPRLVQTDKGNGSISAAGQNNRFNSITIDGVTTSDTFGLESNNLPTKKQPISIDAIAAVQVNLSNYDVTQKGYTGANINAVTKSGTNEFHGSVYYVTRDDKLVGKAYNRASDSYTDFAPFKENTKGFTLGGPIIADKLFFFGGYEELKSSKARPAFGPLGSSLINVGISQSAIDSAIAIAKNTWAFDAGTPVVPGSLELVVKDTLFKLDWNISDQHRANLRYSKTEQSDPVITTLFSPNQLSLSTYWYVTAKTLETTVGQWFADWTPDFSTELKVSQRDYKQRHTPVSGTRLPAVRLSFAGALPAGTTGVNTGTRTLDFGTEISRQFNVLDTATSDIYAGANWNIGPHELKFGADHSNNKIFNAFLQNANGNYNFQCENSSATLTYTFGAINCATATSAQVEAAVLENFQRGRESSYTGQQPQAGLTLQDAAARFSFANTGLFVQDSWKLDKQLNVMFGVRLDRQNVPTKPLFNSAAAQPLVAGSVNGNVVVRNTGGFGIDNSVTLDGNTLVQPRVGFNWDLSSPERRMQLRGGIGLFQGAAASVWISNPYSNTGRAVNQISCANVTLCAGVPFRTDPDNQPATAPGTPPAAVVDALSPDLEQPSVWKFNLAFERELPALPVVGTLVAGAEWLHTKTKSGIFYQHLNLGGATRTGSDGRDLFYRGEGYDPNCYAVAANGNVSNLTTGTCATPAGFSRTRALSNSSFGNVILAQQTTQGYGDAVTLTLSRPPVQGWGYGIGYTRTIAKEVSPLTSSTSNSNWNGRNIFNPNEEVLQSSNYAIRDRITANLVWQQAFIGTYRTSVGVFYEGRKGKPYSWTYNNDLNGDGISGNDLMYIPSAPGSSEVIFKGGTAEEARFWEVVNANPALSSARGGVVGRNNSYAPWVNNVDVRLSQELPGFTSKHKAVFTLDILNFGNLLNKKWGHIDEIDFPSRRSFVSYAGIDPATRKYIYSLAQSANSDFITKQNERESQWAIQATLRYEF